MTQHVGMAGHAPGVSITPVVRDERAIYEQMWAHEEYRAVAPGEHVGPVFLAHARPKPGSTVIDFGCGTGRGAMMIALLGGVKVHMIDFAANCLDPEVREALTTQHGALEFLQHDLREPVPISAPYGYCTDVLEHVPPADVDRVLSNILMAARHVFFQISCEEDRLGALIGKPLHLSVHDHAWWLAKLQALGAAVHWSEDGGSYAMFYCTAWASGKDIVEVGVLNTEEQTVLANVTHNIAQGWDQVWPHLPQDTEVMILGGGPSLARHEAEIRRLRNEGVKLVTLNGAYNWAVERGLKVSATVVVDARPFNARFTHPVMPETKYLIASQCDPAVLDGLPRDRTLLWHTSAEFIRPALDAQYNDRGGWCQIPGGSTVLLRAIPLLRMLGYSRFHLFGCDSCLEDDAHHAFAQPENDGQGVLATEVGGRVFRCHPWMVAQGQEFIDLIRVFGDEIELEVYGDGLLAHILKTGAEADDLNVGE